MGKPYEDPEKLAEARFYGGEKHSQQEMADYLDCGKGTISLKMRKYEDELEQYGPEDFEDVEVGEEETDTFPIELDLPDEWPPDQNVLDDYFGSGVSEEVIVDEARWGCPNCYPTLDALLQNEFGRSIAEITRPQPTH